MARGPNRAPGGWAGGFSGMGERRGRERVRRRSGCVGFKEKTWKDKVRKLAEIGAR